MISRRSSSDCRSPAIRSAPRWASHSASTASSTSRARSLRAAAARGDHHQSGARVGGVGPALDVAGALELVDEEPGRLLGHLGGGGELGEPHPLLVEPGGEPGLGEGEVVEPAGPEVVDHPLLDVAHGDEHPHRGRRHRSSP